MIDNSKFSVFDGNEEIIYSNTFNVYSNELKIGKIGGFDLFFNFIKDTNINDGQIILEPNNENREIKIILTNFGTSLGTGTTNKIPLMTIGSGSDKKEILFSLYGTSLMDSLSLLQITLTIYAK